jgi:hypothetical protein
MLVGAVTAGAAWTAPATAAGACGTAARGGVVDACAPDLLAVAVVVEPVADVETDTWAGAVTLGLVAATLLPATLTLTLVGALTCG